MLHSFFSSTFDIFCMMKKSFWSVNVNVSYILPSSEKYYPPQCVFEGISRFQFICLPYQRWGSCCVGAHSIAHWPGAQADMDKTLLSILWVSPLCNDTKNPIFAATAVVDAITGKRPTSCGLHRLSSIFHFNPLHKLSHNLHYDSVHTSLS